MRLIHAAIRFLFLGIAVSVPAQTQQHLTSTYAGVPRHPLGIFFSLGVAADVAGNVYFSGSGHDGVLNVAGCFCVFKLDQNGVVTRMARNSQTGYSGDGGLAASALLNRPAGLAVDGAGNLFIVDGGNNSIRKISPDGTITTVADNGTLGHFGDGGPATNAPLREPRAVAPDAGGNLFIADDSRRVRKVSPDGIITAVAGVGPSSLYPWDECGAGLPGDGAPATKAPLCTIGNVVADRVCNLFINELGYSQGDATNVAVRKVSPDGIITTVAADRMREANRMIAGIPR